MGTENEKNQQNPGQRQQDDPGNVNDPSRKGPSQSRDAHNPQDPIRKNPGQSGDAGDRRDREGSEGVEKRRAS